MKGAERQEQSKANQNPQRRSRISVSKGSKARRRKKGKDIGRYRRIQSENHAGLTMASDTTVKEARCRISDGDDEVGSGRDTGPGS